MSWWRDAGVADAHRVVEDGDRLRRCCGESRWSSPNEGDAQSREKENEEGAPRLVVADGKEPMIPAGFIKLHWERRGGGGGLAVRWCCMWGVRGKRATKQNTI